ncbi:MAG: DEAD/DEAH box helicase, partial [Acidimicrobiales bacterium]
MALQFELVPQRRAGRASPATAGIRIRPVLRSPQGNWVRTGISWSKLDYRYAPAGIAAERQSLLRELLAVSHLSPLFGHYRYSSYGSDPQVWLEDFSSRRLWDLLGHAEELQVPLVVAGGKHGAVRLLREPAVVGADLVAAGAGLRMSPYVEGGGERVPLGSSLLIGDPPHGLAWWPGPHTGDGARQLAVAPFPRPLGQGERALIQSTPLDVPGRDRERFLREFYPRLARSVAVVSPDHSVDLPEVPRAVLVLWLRHQGQRSVARWQRGLEGSSWRDDLWRYRDQRVEHEVEDAVEAATQIVRSVPAMLEQAWVGERLAPSAELSGMDAVRFITELLPALAQVPGLVIEETGDAPGYREASGAPVVSLRPAGSGFDGDWFDLAVEVSIDGEEVIFQELFVALAERRSHLVLASGTYFALDRPELAELAELIAEARAMQDRDTAAPDQVRLSRFQAGLWEDLRRLGVRTEQAEAWEAAVRALAEAGDDIPVEPPDGLDATLRPYQHEGFSWLALLYRHRLGGILADDMGLGKTLQALSLVCHARQVLGVEEPFLVVAPTSVVENWATECGRFAPELRVATVAETAARRWVSLSDLADKADVVITSYTLFRLEYQDYERISWAGLFLDEAQFVKNPRSLAHQRAKALPAPFKLAITGTPIENGLKELWALLSITAPGLFPRSDRFAEHFAVPIERRADAERLSQLRRRIRPLVLRRTKGQVESELPDKQEQVLELELAPKHRRLYQTHLQRERQKILGLLGDMDRHRFEILRSLTVLRQAALDVSLVDDRCRGVPSTKLDVLTEMLGEIVADGHRVLVFSQFTRFLSAAAARAGAAGIDHCYLDGRTRKREKVIATFREGKAPAFFISLKAGGFGLNLTEADYCIVLDPWWNPATEAQAVDRAHRIGQTRKVMVYRLVAKDTIEEKVMALKA